MIIAEAGVNHNGSMETARQLIDAAAEAGVDIVKFQTFNARKLVSRNAEKADYQKQTTDAGESQLQMLQKLELSHEDHLELIAYCQRRSIAFLSTPFDLDSIDLLKELGVRTGKIPSGEVTNLPYLVKMAATFEELILSTGMSDLQEVEEAIGVITATGFPKEKLTVLHCTTEYPTPFADVNLRAMQRMGADLGLKTGYSDHTLGIEVPIAAVAMGACLIEKHFTLSREMEGPDHKASLEPQELTAMVRAIRNIEAALGDGTKVPSPAELKNKGIARKSIVAAQAIRKGELFTEANLTVKRPGTGISPMKWREVLGQTAPRDFEADDLIELA